jgi:hypothetical protein
LSDLGKTGKSKSFILPLLVLRLISGEMKYLVPRIWLKGKIKAKITEKAHKDFQSILVLE